LSLRERLALQANQGDKIPPKHNIFDAVKGVAPGDRDILAGKIGQKRTKEKEDFEMDDDDDGPQSYG
jgi:hypothetical protein